MNGLDLIRAIDWRTSCSRSLNDSGAHCGLTPVSLFDLLAEVVVGEGQHPAVGVVDQDDLLGPEQPLRDGQGADLVVGDDPAGVADHVGVALVDAEDVRRHHARVHAGHDGDLERGRERQVALVEAVGVALGIADQLVGGAHIPLKSDRQLGFRCSRCGAGCGARAGGSGDTADHARGCAQPQRRPRPGKAGAPRGLGRRGARARRPHRPRPQPQRVHPRRPPGRTGSGAGRARAGGGRRDRPATSTRAFTRTSGPST